MSARITRLRWIRSEEHTSELQSLAYLVCRLVLEKKKCSACSRVYVERSVAGEFTGRLADRAAQLRVGDPLDRDTYMVPVIDTDAVERFRDAVKEARKEGRVLAGGEVLKDDNLPKGNYVAPTGVGDLPTDHLFFRDAPSAEIYTLSLHDALPI